jgi:hypothetical protein
MKKYETLLLEKEYFDKINAEKSDIESMNSYICYLYEFHKAHKGEFR